MTDKVQKIREEVERLKESGCESPIVICDTLLSFIDSLQEEPKPKFKVGDRICKSKIGDLKGVVINEIYSDHYMCNGACIYFTEQDDWELVEDSVHRTKADVDAAMQDVEEKSKAFTDAHKGESAEEILAQMKGEEPILDLLAKYLDHVSHEEAMKTKDAIDRWFSEYYPEPVSEDLEEVAVQYSKSIHSDYINDMFDGHNIYDAVIYGAQWQKERDKDEIRMIRELLDNFDKTCDEYHDAGFKHGQEALMKDAVDTTIKQGCTELGIFIKGLDENKFSFGDKVKVIVIKED